MNEHATFLKGLHQRLHEANKSIDGPLILEAAAEIERLEDELTIWRRMKTDPACVRANMLRGEIAMLTEVEQFHALQERIAELEAELGKETK